jgi:hypothetical protein
VKRFPGTVAIGFLATILISCAGEDPAPAGTPGGAAPGAAPAAVANPMQAEVEEEVRRRFQRPALKNYLMLPSSFTGGTFPKEIAGLLREVQQHAGRFISHLESTGGDTALLNAHRALDKFAGKTAELYEFMAGQPAGSVRDMREGLVMTDDLVRAQYDSFVDQVNAAHEQLDQAIRGLPAEHQASFRRMAVATRLST